MDILIDIIIYLIKQASKPRDVPVNAPPAQKLARQRAIEAQRAAAVKKVLTAQQARTAVRGRKPVARPSPAPMPPTWSQPQPRNLSAALAPAAVTKGVATVVSADPSKQPARPGWQIPLLLGEILGPPAALREPEF